MAGLDSTGITQYFNALKIKEKLNYVRNEVARGIMNGMMDEKEAVRWLKEYGLLNNESAVKYISFIKANRSYVINYNYGKDVAHNYITSKGGDESDDKRWSAFTWMLKNQIMPADLVGNE